MHEHIARTMYYFSIHLLYASIVGCAALALTSIRSASATTKYWIWVATAFNFIVPSGALVDKLWASHLSWARPLGAIGDPVWDITQGWTAVVLAVVWIARIRHVHATDLAHTPRARRNSDRCARSGNDVEFYGRWHPSELR